MSARDELGKLLFTLPVSDRAADAAPEIMTLCDEAAEVLLEAGYWKPRTITTAEELDALEVGAVVRGKWLAEKWADEEGELWYVAGNWMRWDTEQLVQRGGLPAEVLQEAR